MNQYVRNWDFDEEAIMFEINKLPAHSTALNTPPETVTSLANSLAELTWEKRYMGYEDMQDLDQRVLNIPISPWDDNPRAGGTLESVVNQATWHSQPKSGLDDINEILLWVNHEIPAMVNPTATATASTAVTFEPLVPRHNNMPMFEFNHEPYTYAQGTGISDVAGCSTQLVPLGVGGGGVEVAGVGINNNTVEREILSGMDMTLLVNNISGQDYTKTSADHYDSITHSRSQITEDDEEGKKKLGKGKSPISAKSRAAAIHNESERKRRDRINQKLKVLQELVPNSSKTDKVSMLDKTIECVKKLQAEAKVMSIRSISPMMMPLSMQQQVEMSMMGVTNNINHVGALPPPVVPPPIMLVSTASGHCLPTPPTTTIFMPASPVTLWDNSGNYISTPSMISVMPHPTAAVFACESQPMTVDAYNGLATMYQ